MPETTDDRLLAAIGDARFSVTDDEGAWHRDLPSHTGHCSANAERGAKRLSAESYPLPETRKPIW